MTTTNVQLNRKIGKAAVLPTAPAFSFGKRLEKPPREVGPGPGQYVTSENVLKRVDGSFPSTPTKNGSFKRSSYSGERTQDPAEPSPARSSSARGASTSRFDGGRGRYASEGTAYHTALISSSPGPGAYDPSVDAVRTRRPGAAWSRSARLGPDGTSSSSRRSSRCMTPVIPTRGPVEYGACGPLVKYTAGHDISSLHRSTPAFSFGQDPHGRAIVAQGQPLDCRSVLTGRGIPKENPGPGEYEPMDPSRHTRPIYSIGNLSSAPKTKLKYPGPGKYNPDLADGLTRRSAPRSTLGMRLPSPGVGGGIVTSSVGRNFPGPGQYSPKLDAIPPGSPTRGATLKFRHSMNDDLMQMRATPAPHDYADKDFYGSDTLFGAAYRDAGFTMAGRWRADRREHVPGPQYAVGCSTLGMAAFTEFETPEKILRTSVL